MNAPALTPLQIQTNFQVQPDKKSAILSLGVGPLGFQINLNLESWKNLATGILTAIRDVEDQRIMLTDALGRMKS